MFYVTVARVCVHVQMDHKVVYHCGVLSRMLLALLQFSTEVIHFQALISYAALMQTQFVFPPQCHCRAWCSVVLQIFLSSVMIVRPPPPLQQTTSELW